MIWGHFLYSNFIGNGPLGVMILLGLVLTVIIRVMISYMHRAIKRVSYTCCYMDRTHLYEQCVSKVVVSMRCG